MNFKENWKRFWTLDRHHAAGFTLVELIVVIAILAILAGVAVPAYSGYVTQANKQADISLVSDIKQALLLAYYNQKLPKGGFVILTKDGVDDTNIDGAVKAALEASFGSVDSIGGLKYDGWTLSNSMPSAEDAAKVAKSSYYQNSTPAKLVSSFTGLTDSLAGMARTASQDPLDTMKGINIMTEDEYTVMRNQLDGLGLTWSSEEGADNTAYTTAVSNLLVQKVATEIGGDTFVEDENPSSLAELAVAYAQIYAWASTGDAEGVAALEKINGAIADKDASSTSVVNAVDEAMQTAQAAGSSFSTYNNSQGMNDLYGLSAIMGTVSGWSDGKDMTTSGLYSSDSITDAVNNYITAVGTMSGMDDTEASALAAALGNGVVVFVSTDGTVGCNISLD